MNTVPLTKIWEQMHLSWQYGADRIWIVNVGDLKPMEYPIEFFLRYAWRPADWPYERLGEYAECWAARQFGADHAAEIARLLDGYTKLNGRRKPELLAPDTFSIVNYREAAGVLAEWKALAETVTALDAKLPAEARAAFFQLVLHPITACRIVNEMYVAAGRNRLYAVQGRVSAHAQAAQVRELFRQDAALPERWDQLLDGKWRHLMDQTHLGYTSWQQEISANWAKVPPGMHAAKLTVRGPAGSAPIVIAMPVSAPPAAPAPGSPRLEYELVFQSTGTFPIEVECAPSWDFTPGEPFRFAASLDDQPPAEVRLSTASSRDAWERAVAENVRRGSARITVESPGRHVLKIWRVSPGVVIERIVIDTGGLRPSYLGPPESVRASR